MGHRIDTNNIELIQSYVDRYERGESMGSIARSIPCHPATVAKAIKHKIINFRGQWAVMPEIKEKAKELFLLGHPVEEIGRILSIDGESARNYLKALMGKDYHNEIKRRDQRGDKSNITLRDNLFKDLKDEGAAYALGWITSDGNLNSSGPGDIRLDYHKQDFDLTNQFKSIFNGGKDYIWKRCVNMINFRLYSKEMRKDLELIGLTENKSLTLRINRDFKDINMKAFLRGVFEGDGWVTITSNNRGMQVGISSGSMMFTEQLKTFMEKELHLRPTIKITSSESGFKSRIGSCGGIHFGYYKEAVKFLNYIYDNPIYYLSRKYNKYLKFLKDNPRYKDTNFLNSNKRNFIHTKYDKTQKDFPIY